MEEGGGAQRHVREREGRRALSHCYDLTPSISCHTWSPHTPPTLFLTPAASPDHDVRHSRGLGPAVHLELVQCCL